MSSRTMIPISAHPQDRQDQRGRLLSTVSALPRRSRRVLGRARQKARLDQAVHQSKRRLVRWRCPHRLVRGWDAQRLLQLHRPPFVAARRSDCDPVGGRRSGRGSPHNLSRIARRGVPFCQRPEGARRQKGRPRNDLPADDPRDCGGGPGLRPDRRDPLGRVRRVLPGQPRRAYPRLPVDLSGDRR